MKTNINLISNKQLVQLAITTLTALALLITSCGEVLEPLPVTEENARFIDFSTNGQTLPSAINDFDNMVKLEVSNNVNVAQLIPNFTIPDGYSAFVNGSKQVSGSTQIDFSIPVTYDIVDDNNQTTSWHVSVVPVACRIIIDASHDGGVWWFPQYEGTGFDSDKPHQGQSFANVLRNKGFEVTEIGRGVELTEEMFFGHYIVIRANGFQAYSTNEIEVYSKLIDRGMNLVFFTDHKKNDQVDELGDHLGLKFEGIASGFINTFEAHEITENIYSINYNAGSVITNADYNSNIEVLGWLGPEDFADLNFNGIKDANEPLASPVMGILSYPKSRIFFIGDMNGIEVQPQPFIDNLINWMGDCSSM